MNGPWRSLAFAPFLFSALLLVASQAVFLQASLHRDLGYGALAPEITFENYLSVLRDGFYLRALGLSMEVSAAAALITVGLGFPVAYVLARLEGRWTMVLMAVIVLTSFISIVIKIYGLIIIFSADGMLNHLLMTLGLAEQPITIFGTRLGVVIGLTYFTFGFGVLVLYAIIRAIPRSLEEAAAVHGANRYRVFHRVILPLSLPGLSASFLTVFNMSMGAFTSAALLGGGKILTIPVLIQRSILMDIKYGVGGVLSVLLMAAVLAVNVLSLAIIGRSGRRQKVTA
jgi:ABC-type spermidine/putrescine transport system permease subunit I